MNLYNYLFIYFVFITVKKKKKKYIKIFNNYIIKL